MAKKKESRKVAIEAVRTNRKRLLNNESPFAIKEAYVKLRTSLMFCMTADKERPCTSFAVTSSKPSEGKSLTAANIAISYAMLGKKVLLIDADMRKPTQRRLWRVEKPTGLCDFLAKISKLELDKVKDLPLWIVCTGTIPPNPSELLSSERMKHFVEESTKVYDYVIIDTPPINTVADAQIVSTYVDGVVLVVKSGDPRTGHQPPDEDGRREGYRRPDPGGRAERGHRCSTPCGRKPMRHGAQRPEYEIREECLQI